VPPNEQNNAAEPPLPVAVPVTADDAGYEVVPEAEARAWRERLPLARRPRMAVWVRGILLLMAAGFVAVFVTAAWIRPYSDDGTPLRMATHTQLGMPPCNMVELTGKPCPACGMTSSFSLLIHGDLAASLRANWVGTLLALYWLALVPWAVAGALKGKLFFVRSGELLLTWSVGVVLALMLARWAAVLLQG
jgi:hypothetical protein